MESIYPSKILPPYKSMKNIYLLLYYFILNLQKIIRIMKSEKI